MQTLIGPAALSHLSPATAHYLTSRSFFPHLISRPFGRGLTEAFSFAAGACALGAVASLLRGGKYHYVEPGAEPETVQEPVVVTSQEAIAETEPLLVD
jgi:hypothetical protein